MVGMIMKIAAFGVIVGGVLPVQQASAEANRIASGMGHDLAQRLCTGCHLIEPGAANSADHVGGPSFQSVADRPNLTKDGLLHHLRTTHMETGGPIPLSMPNPHLTDDELVKITSYLLSLHAQ